MVSCSVLLSSFVIAGLDKRENVGMHNSLTGNMGSNCETTLYFKINLSSTIIGWSNTETFRIWILNVNLDLIALLSPQLTTHCLGELLNTISVFRLNERTYKEGIN